MQSMLAIVSIHTVLLKMQGNFNINLTCNLFPDEFVLVVSCYINL